MLLDMLGGFTLQVRNPDSWEGWYWGAKHIWGMEPVGLQWPYNANVFPDILKHSETTLMWGCDPETTNWGFGAVLMSRYCYHLTEMGIKQIYICPDLNYGAGVHADKWIPILPNTDAALQLAIAYQWIVEDTYDKEYLKTHAVGFEKFKAYVLGEEDGIAKTPEWAAGKCHVPSRIIKALARRFARTATSIVHCLGGPYIRGAYSTEPARLEVVLLAMQGLGRPGVNQASFITGAFFCEAVTGRTCRSPMPQAKQVPFLGEAYTGLRPIHAHAEADHSQDSWSTMRFSTAISRFMAVRIRCSHTHRSIQEVCLSGSGLLAHSHDLERHSLLDDLLERLEPQRRGIPA